MTNKQWWSCQVDKPTAEKYKQYFRENNIYFEPSEAYSLVHISFEVSEQELKAMDDWIRKELFKTNKKGDDLTCLKKFIFTYQASNKSLRFPRVAETI